MPVILTTPTEFERWLEADTPDALALQRPLPDDALQIVARGNRTGDVQMELWPPSPDSRESQRVGDAT
jgi:putative SOS response-associated peptidase YedK